MYICECGAEFDECAYVFETHSWLDDSPKEKIGVCPECGGDGFDEAVKCERPGCGKYVAKHDLDNGLCPGCQNETAWKFQQYMNFFSKPQIEYLASRAEAADLPGLI